MARAGREARGTQGPIPHWDKPCTLTEGAAVSKRKRGHQRQSGAGGCLPYSPWWRSLAKAPVWVLLAPLSSAEASGPGAAALCQTERAACAPKVLQPLTLNCVKAW